MQSDGPNAAMRRYWNEHAGPLWVQGEQIYETMLAPFSAALMGAVPIELGDTVVDVGCGYGSTLLAAARDVGPAGRAIGIDISDPMVDASQARIADVPHASAHVADAQVDDLTAICGTSVDVIVSRFGVMFFDDPVAAFANIRRVARHGATLAFTCWQEPERNPWHLQPARLLLGALPDPPPAVAPTAPGPFALRDPAHVRTVLERAGWGAVDIEPIEAPMQLGGGAGVEGAVRYALMTSAGQLAQEQLDTARLASVVASLRELFAGQSDEAGSPVFPAAAWLVLARSR